MNSPFPSNSDRFQTFVERLVRSNAEFEKIDKLGTLFPVLKARLSAVIEATGADSSVCQMASRHIISAEALVEILEEQRASRSKPLTADDLVSAYSEKAAEKVLGLHSWPSEEAGRICNAYPEVNLRHIIIGFQHGLIKRDGIAAALEEITEYEILLRELNQAGLL